MEAGTAGGIRTPCPQPLHLCEHVEEVAIQAHPLLPVHRPGGGLVGGQHGRQLAEIHGD